MRFLGDDHLPPALARMPTEAGHLAEHVGDVGLSGADDKLIWQHARATSAVIISKDRDFPALQSRQPDGPAIVWVRRGNTRKKRLLERIRRLLPIVVLALEAGQKIVEIA